MKYQGLDFQPVSIKNLAVLVKVQSLIFPGESAKQNYLETIEHNPYRRELANWLVLHKSKPIGVVGLYSYHEYPHTAWLGWFGVVPEERGKKFGSAIFDFWIETARKKGYSEARLYTDKFANKEALPFYLHKGMVAEEYRNALESKGITDTTILFSLSLTNKPIEKWNDRFLELTEQLEKQDRSE